MSIHGYGRGYLCYFSHASSDDGREQGKEQIDRCPFIEVPGDGSAMIFGPDGTPLVEPLPPGEEGILYADIDLSIIELSKQTIDVLGHYSRPDLSSFACEL